MPDPHLTDTQEAQAQAIYQRLKNAFDAEALRLARLMASKDDAHLLGETEFQVRDRVHDLGAHVLHITLDEKKKAATKGPAPVARTAATAPAASASAKKPSSP
jgi:hypothetical protein